MLHLPAWLRGILMLIATAMAWGGMFPVIKTMLKFVDPITLTWLRFGFSSLILVLMLFLIEGKESFRFEGKILKLWWLGTLGFAGFGIFLVMGVQRTIPEHAAVIPTLMPLIALTIMAIRIRTFPKPKAIVSIFLGIVGVLLVISVGDLSLILNGVVGRGELLILCGATCWVLYTIGASNFPHWSGLRYTTLTILLGTLSISLIEVIALIMQWVEFPSISILLHLTPQLSYLVLIASVMGFLFWNGGMRILGAEKGVLFINLVPVTAIGIAFMQGKSINVWELCGVSFVIIALFVNSINITKKYS